MTNADVSATLPELRARAADFGHMLDSVKSRHPNPPSWGWYPYRMLPSYVEIFDRLLKGENRRLLEQPAERRVADLAGADGDLSFFLESVGFEVDLFEFDSSDEPVKDARLLPSRLLKESLRSSVSINGLDLDREFELPRTYNLVFLLGALYHMKNPYLTLETLSRYARYCILSTRTMRFFPWRGALGRMTRSDVSSIPVAYLLDEYEINPIDPTNRWVFSEAGLRRILQRTGWTVLDFLTAGNQAAAPTSNHEARAWCLVRSERVADL